MTPAAGLSAGTLLGGRVSYAQPREGYRTGIEPVLLAAAVAARLGEQVVEAGTGAGAGLLCLAARVGSLSGLGLECDPGMAAVAAANFAANRFDGLHAQLQDVTDWRPATMFDHAMANPPWHSEAGTPSGEPGRHLAKTASKDLLGSWTAALAGALRHRGTLTLILPAASLAQGVVTLVDAKCAEISILPLWKQSGSPARLVILRGVRHGRGSTRLLAGLVLHTASGAYTAEAEDVLREGAPLPN